MTREELLDALESGKTGPALDRHIARFFGWIEVRRAPRFGTKMRRYWVHPADTQSDGYVSEDSLHGIELYREPPRFTVSVDAAMTLLVPDGWEFQGISRLSGDRWLAHFCHAGMNSWIDGESVSPSAAICAGALRSFGDD